MPKRRLSPLLIALILLTACLGGKGGTPPPAAATPVQGRPSLTAPKTVIQFATYDHDQGRYQNLVEAFNQDNPGIEIRLVSIDEILGLSPQQRKWPDDAWPPRLT